jgi:ABC-type Fe3+-siderophore transport system permease subunit
MQRLARVNRTQAFLGTLALVLIGLFAPGWYGAIVLFALVVGLTALLVRTGAYRDRGTVTVQLLILAGVAVIAVYKVL